MTEPFASCLVAELPLVVNTQRVFLDPNDESLATARTMAIAYQVGDVMRTLDAVEEVNRRFFEGTLDIVTPEIRNQVYCWESVGRKFNGAERVGLMARVFGVDDPRRLERDRVNSEGRKLLTDLLTALDSLRDAICNCNGNLPLGALEPAGVAGRALKAHFASVVTGVMAMQVREWAGQVSLGVRILNDLDPGVLRARGRGVLGAPLTNHWPTVEALLADASPADLIEGQEKTDAWETIFDWLGTDLSLDEPVRGVVADASTVLSGSWRKSATKKPCC